MPEVYEYLKSAASQFQMATAHFKDAEDSLHNLEAKLEESLKRLRNLTQDKSLPAPQPDTFVSDSQPVDQLVDREESPLIGS